MVANHLETRGLRFTQLEGSVELPIAAILATSRREGANDGGTGT